MTSSPDVMVIGGGVIGLTSAYFLARKGVRAVVLDKGDIGSEASWAGAGILSPSKATSRAHPFELLRTRSVAAFSQLSADLRDCTGIDNGYLRSGGLELITDADCGAESEWRTEGAACEFLQDAALHGLEPELAATLTGGYFLPGMAQLRNPRHIKALSDACRTLGAKLQPGCAVLRLKKNSNRITSVETTIGPRSAGQYLFTTGAWCDELLEQIGLRPGVRPIRGQIALLQLTRPLFQRILLQGSRYLVPRADGRVLIGSTEEDVGFDKRTTAEAIQDLLRLGMQLVPSLAEAHLERCWAGLRPRSPDGLPILGRVPGYQNAYVAAGHYRAGIQLSPGTAEVMTQLLLGDKPSVPLEAFALERFALSSNTASVEA